MLRPIKKEPLLRVLVLALAAIILSPLVVSAVCLSKMPACCCGGKCSGPAMPEGHTGTNNCCTIGNTVPLVPALAPSSTNVRPPDNAWLADCGLPFHLRLVVSDTTFLRVNTFLLRVNRTDDLSALICTFLL